MKYKLFLRPDQYTKEIRSKIADAVWKTNSTGFIYTYWDAHTTPPAYVVECDERPADLPEEGLTWQES